MNEFDRIIFMNFRVGEVHKIITNAVDEYVNLGVATAIAFTYPSAQS